MKIIGSKWRVGLALLLVAIIGASIFASSACRRRRPPHPGKKFDRLLEHLTQDLNLTAAQQEELEVLRRGLHERRRAMHRSRRQHMERIISLVRQDDVSYQAAWELDQQMVRRHLELKEFMIQGFVNIHATLTPEQRQRLADRLEEVHRRKMERMQKRRGKHGPRLGPPEHGPPDLGPPERGPF